MPLHFHFRDDVQKHIQIYLKQISAYASFDRAYVEKVLLAIVSRVTEV